MSDQFDSIARSTGAKIVLGGGVDSIPSDLGTYLALEALQPAAGQRVDVRGVYTEYTGSFSGGTLNSGRATAKAKREGRLTKALANDPYLLAPELGAGFRGADSVAGTASGMQSGWKRSWCTDGYAMLMDFFMAPINARVVRRSLALKGGADGAAAISYSECCSVGMWARALCVWMSRGFGYDTPTHTNTHTHTHTHTNTHTLDSISRYAELFTVRHVWHILVHGVLTLLTPRDSRYFVGQPINFKPQSGEGPPPWLLKCGTFRINVTATVFEGSATAVVVRGKGDPGYGATSKMLAETGQSVSQPGDLVESKPSEKPQTNPSA
jgi:short subunit dehydrogenase-like uncharacterized protein